MNQYNYDQHLKSTEVQKECNPTIYYVVERTNCVDRELSIIWLYDIYLNEPYLWNTIEDAESVIPASYKDDEGDETYFDTQDDRIEHYLQTVYNRNAR